MAYFDEYNTAKELLTEFGTKVTLKKLVSNDYDEENLVYEKVYSEFTGVGCRFNYTDEAIGVSNNIIQAGDVYILCQLDEEPTVDSDQVVLGRYTYSVVSCKDLSPDDSITILYKLQCRKVE